MGKITKILFSVVGFALLIIIIMFVAQICPPAGPWPTPPWCGDNKFEAITYETTHIPGNLDIVPAVNMFDTWGKNYNFGMFENTRNNIESSFDRVASLGAKEVYVHDFHRAVYEGEVDFASLNYELVDEIFLNDMRDESMTEKDIKKLTETAHANNLEIGINHNIAFVNIGKYIKQGGNIDENVQKDFAEFNKSHSEEWIKDFFAKWQSRLVAKAKIYEKYGIDIMSITPNWMGPTYAGHEKLANELQKELIKNIRQVFSGQIHVGLNEYGFIAGKNGSEDYTKYNYYKDADIIQLSIYNLRKPYILYDNPDLAEIKKGFERYLNEFEAKAVRENIKISVMFSPFS
jgi:hypothetical protein